MHRQVKGPVVQRDLDWLDEMVAWNWKAPSRAAPFWRRRGVRHIRAAASVAWAYLTFNPLQPDWNALWRTHWLAYAIRRGWC